MNDSTRLARTVVQALLDAGVREAVLSPGSRNAPLSFALLDAERAGALRLHIRIDERSAGFLALGLTRTSGRPVVVSCTSGTAVANLAPAALEAHHEHLPWVAVTADRPLRLRGTSANQTTDQIGLLARATTADVAAGDAIADVVADLLTGRGPAHLNVQFDEPLTPDDRWVPEPAGERARVVPAPAAVRTPTTLPRGPRTVVVAGDGAGAAARELAEQAGWPLLAEPSSGARAGVHAIAAYRMLLDTDLGAEIQRVVVAGHPTLSRPVSRLLGRDDVEVVDLAPDRRWQPRPFAVARVAAACVVDGAPDDSPWLLRWQEAGRSLAAQIQGLLRAEADVTPHEVAAVVARSVRAGDLLFVGPSNPVRDLDLMMASRPVGATPDVVANRGLAGIDGVVSSAIGAALAHPGAGRAVALLGDVTFLHDAGGLVLGPQEPRPDLTLVVVNDDGGSIFALLEQGSERYADAFERVFGTPHGVDLASWCAATRTPHWRVESVPELEHALARPAGGIEVVEVRVRRDNRREIDERVRDLRP